MVKRKRSLRRKKYPAKRNEKIGHTSRVQGVNVDTEIHRLARADSIYYFLDNPGRPDRVNRTSFDNFEAAIAVIFIVAETRQGCPDASMNIGVVGEQTFQVGMIKVGPMVDRCLRGWRPTEHFGPPGIPFHGYQVDSLRTGELLNCLQVTVEVNHANGAISSVNTPQQRKSNRVITAEGNDSW